MLGPQDTPVSHSHAGPSTPQGGSAQPGSRSWGGQGQAAQALSLAPPSQVCSLPH